MLHFDTNALIALPLWARLQHPLVQRVVAGEPAAVSSMVWYEFRVGPLAPDEFKLALAFLQSNVLPLTMEDAELAAYIYNKAGRKRVYKTDAIIAAVAIREQAEFVTLNYRDFVPFVEMGLVIAEIDNSK